MLGVKDDLYKLVEKHMLPCCKKKKMSIGCF